MKNLLKLFVDGMSAITELFQISPDIIQKEEEDTDFLGVISDALGAALRILVCPSRVTYDELTHDQKVKDPQ